MLSSACIRNPQCSPCFDSVSKNSGICGQFKLHSHIPGNLFVTTETQNRSEQTNFADQS